MSSTKKQKNTSIERPPIVVVLGHVDHGKSTLLDTIRNTNIVDDEAGGITQHTAAYEVVRADKDGTEKKITFIDTPGHEAFQAQRSRGAKVADIAILIVSAEDGVKAQTLEAHKAITEQGIPYVVAINKIDTPKANPEKTIASLMENGIYLEGRGGDVPFALISAKQGDGIEELLETVLLVAELEELKADPSLPAEGVIVEAHRDPKKGISATLIITEGTLSKGGCIATETAYCPVRLMESHSGTSLDSATVSAPITLVGWNDLPVVGSTVHMFAKKKEAEKFACSSSPVISPSSPELTNPDEDTAIVPLIIKADVSGTIDAIEHELNKLKQERVHVKILKSDVGTISEGDIQSAGGDDRTVVIGFNTKVESGAQDLAERTGITIKTASIIYELAEWLQELLIKRTPRREVQELVGEAKILKTFSATKNKQVIGGRVENGLLQKGNTVQIMRRDEMIGKGTILGLQQGKQETDSVSEGIECGINISSSVEIARGDRLASYKTVVE